MTNRSLQGTPRKTNDEKMDRSFVVGRIVVQGLMWGVPSILLVLVLVLGFINERIDKVEAKQDQDGCAIVRVEKATDNIEYNLKRLFEKEGLRYFEQRRDK